MDNPDISYPAVKAASALAGAGAVSLANLALWTQITAGLLAAIYSSILIGEWVWKRVIRPRMLARGYLKPHGGILTNSDGR